MKKVFRINGAVLAIVLALVLAPFFFNPALIAFALPVCLISAGLLLRKYRLQFSSGFWRNFFADECGAVTVTYYINGGGLALIGTTGPTAAQAQSVLKQTAVISMADTDTQALFTHNWGLSNSAPTYFDPEILYYAQLSTAGGTSLSGLTFDVSNTNVVKINKASFLGSGGSFVVTLRRPHSVGQ